MSVWYSAGEIYLGRVVQTASGDKAVELEPGVTGHVVLEGGGALKAETGTELLVKVTSADEQGEITVVPAEESDRARYGWGAWRARPTGHKLAVTAMEALRDYTDAFLADLKKARRKWEKEKAESQSIYESLSSSARKQHEENKTRYSNEREQNVADTESRMKAPEAVLEAYAAFSEAVSPKQSAARNWALLGAQSVQDCGKKVRAALKAKQKAYEELCNVCIAESRRDCEEKLDRANQERIDRDTHAERCYQGRTRKIRELREEDIRRGFGQEMLRTYAQGARATRFNAASYECPTEIPDYITLGTIGLDISNESPDDMTVVQTAEAQVGEFSERVPGGCMVRIPYCQRLSDGISLLMRYAPEDRSYAQSLIQPLLLKLFLSFPAGKLEATMIDPLELGASFPDIPRLAEGTNSARIIDTKIWSKERDIENAIATLRQRLENMTQAYGGDQKSRLRKEAVRVLAITDFPTGFSQTALKDLHAIVRNSAALGVCVLICANDAELKKLGVKDSTLLTEITQSVVDTSVRNRRLMLAGSDRIFLQMDDMGDVLAHKDQILSTISSAIERGDGGTDDNTFEKMFPDDIYDSNSWFRGQCDEIAIPLGIKGANTVVKMVLGRGGGSITHHALMTGPIGGGKSTLLHTLIMSTMISYSPDEVQMYLLDFKEGVEFSAYTRYRLPSLRVVAINSEREFGLRVLKELCKELDKRANCLARYGATDIDEYMRMENVPKQPKLLLIFDEVQELFRTEKESDSISAECLSCINKLVMQGRAMSIPLLLALQDFRNCAGLVAYFSQMAIRIAVRGSEDGAASIFKPDNSGIRTLQDRKVGAAIYNDRGGVESANNFFQVGYINKEKHKELLTRLDAYYTDPAVASFYEEQVTRVLMTNAEDDMHNCFNRLILEGASSIRPLAGSADGYGLLLGQGFGKKSVFMPELRPRERDNLLVVSRDEKMAMSLFLLSAMSILYEELHTQADKTNALIYIVDLSAEELAEEECDFDYLEDQFPGQVRVAKIGDAEGLIANLYETVMGRAEGSRPADERIFFLFFGINRARRLRSGRLYDDDQADRSSPLEMVQKILRYGPRQRVNGIFWGESTQSIEYMLGDRYEEQFDKRIAWGLDAAEMNSLVSESDPKTLRGKTVAYIDVGEDIKNTHFRPYDIPAKVWVERYAECYDQIISEEGSC